MSDNYFTKPAECLSLSDQLYLRTTTASEIKRMERIPNSFSVRITMVDGTQESFASREEVLCWD